MADSSLDLDLDLDFSFDLESDDTKTRGETLALGLAHPDETRGEWPAENPDYATDQKAQLGATLREMRDLAKRADERTKANIDASYHFSVVFLDYPQMKAFLEATGWNKHGTHHLDGLALAKALGVTLPESSFAPYDLHEDKRLAELSFELPDLT